ncbi:MAG: hypothetical protein HOG24_01845, partial [Candidatus Cloacimonetes bacterium]|nr:hypothetical protein [Candidatus Cloacimonadota bacterium]
MKKFSIILLVLVISVSAYSNWVEVSENNGSQVFDHTSFGKEYTEVNFSLNGYDIETVRENEIDYKKITYWKEGNSLDVGKPDLPKFTRLIAIPNEGTVSFEIINIEEEVIRDITIYPTQELQKESDSKPFKFVVDEEYY